MKKHRSILFIDLAVVIIALLWNFIAVNTQKPEQHANYLFGRYGGAGLVILVLGTLNILSGILLAATGYERGKWLLLFGSVILLIGFSVCSIH